MPSQLSAFAILIFTSRICSSPRRRGFYDPPPEWIYIHIKVGEAPEEQFGGDKDVFKGLPPGTHILPIEENYRDLISGGRVNMPLVPLGKKLCYACNLTACNIQPHNQS